MNKLDGQYYAVKKILIKKASKDDCMKVRPHYFVSYFYTLTPVRILFVGLGPQGS